MTADVGSDLSLVAYMARPGSKRDDQTLVVRIISHTDRSRFHYRRVMEQSVLDLTGRHLPSITDNELAEPIGYVQKPIFIQPAKVTRSEPPIGEYVRPGAPACAVATHEHGSP